VCGVLAPTRWLPGIDRAGASLNPATLACILRAGPKCGDCLVAAMACSVQKQAHAHRGKPAQPAQAWCKAPYAPPIRDAGILQRGQDRRLQGALQADPGLEARGRSLVRRGDDFPLARMGLAPALGDAPLGDEGGREQDEAGDQTAPVKRDYAVPAPPVRPVLGCAVPGAGRPIHGTAGMAPRRVLITPSPVVAFLQ